MRALAEAASLAEAFPLGAARGWISAGRRSGARLSPHVLPSGSV
jgi:hypothetical protein